MAVEHAMRSFQGLEFRNLASISSRQMTERKSINWTPIFLNSFSLSCHTSHQLQYLEAIGLFSAITMKSPLATCTLLASLVSS